MAKREERNAIAKARNMAVDWLIAAHPQEWAELREKAKRKVIADQQELEKELDAKDEKGELLDDSGKPLPF